MKLKVEKWFPYPISLSLAGAWFLWGSSRPTYAAEILSAAVGLTSITVAFLITAQSILVTLEGRRVMKRLQQARRAGVLFDYVAGAVHWSMFAAAASLVALFVLPERAVGLATSLPAMPTTALTLQHAASALYIGILTVAITTTGRAVWLFAKLVRVAVEESERLPAGASPHLPGRSTP